MKKILDGLSAFGQWALLFVQIRFMDQNVVDTKLIDMTLELPPDMNRMTLDSRYWVCSRENFQRIVKRSWVSKMRYVSDRFDCDNFAFTFKALLGLLWGLNNVGVVIDHSGVHAYNIIVFDDGSWELFEPQSGKFVEPGSQKKYTFTKGQVIL